MMKDYSRIKLVILDVDGTLTDGSILYDAQGGEIKRFNAKDGLGIKMAIEAGLQLAILTGRQSPILHRRVKELGIHHLRENVQIKYPVLMQMIAELGLTADEVGYIGDDLNDLQCMQAVGLSACPADAAQDIRNACDYVAAAHGGDGAVREVLERLLRAQGKWDAAVKRAYFA